MTHPYKTPLTPQTDCSITFKDGRLIFLRDGQLIQLNSPIVFENGVIITADGYVKYLDGSNTKLHEGETFNNL
jgi:hypothetical protein